MKNETTADTRHLLNKIKAGNTQAFRVFVEKYQRLVSHIVFRMVSNTADREDICQDVFLKIYQNINGFRFESKVSTWIGKIAYNTCINHLRKRKIPLFDDFTPESESLDNFPGNQVLPDTFTEKRDNACHLQIEIDNLPLQYRTILTLYHIDEMSYNEIAQIMELPQGTVKSYLFRARKHLKEKLMSKYQKEEIWHSNI